jgi:hypothetical protein
MSSTISQTRYVLNFSVSKGDFTDTGSIALTSDTGVTDGVALSLVEAFNGLSWPSGTTAEIFVTRHAVTEVQSEGDLNATPPVFI